MLELGTLTACPRPNPATPPRATPCREQRGEGLSAGRGTPGLASVPAHHHQLLLCCLLTEALPHVNGEQCAAAVEDGGERAHEGSHDHGNHQASQTWEEMRSLWTTGYESPAEHHGGCSAHRARSLGWKWEGEHVG